MFFLLTGVASSLFMRGRCFSHDLIISSVRDTYVRKQRTVYCYCQTGLRANTTPHQALTAPSWAPPRMDSDVFTSSDIRKYVLHRKDCTLHAASYEKLVWSCTNFSFCRTTEQKRTVRCDRGLSGRWRRREPSQSLAVVLPSSTDVKTRQR